MANSPVDSSVRAPVAPRPKSTTSPLPRAPRVSVKCSWPPRSGVGVMSPACPACLCHATLASTARVCTSVCVCLHHSVCVGASLHVHTRPHIHTRAGAGAHTHTRTHAHTHTRTHAHTHTLTHAHTHTLTHPHTHTPPPTPPTRRDTRRLDTTRTPRGTRPATALRLALARVADALLRRRRGGD